MLGLYGNRTSSTHHSYCLPLSNPLRTARANCSFSGKSLLPGPCTSNKASAKIGIRASVTVVFAHVLDPDELDMLFLRRFQPLSEREQVAVLLIHHHLLLGRRGLDLLFELLAGPRLCGLPGARCKIRTSARLADCTVSA